MGNVIRKDSIASHLHTTLHEHLSPPYGFAVLEKNQDPESCLLFSAHSVDRGLHILSNPPPDNGFQYANNKSVIPSSVLLNNFAVTPNSQPSPEVSGDTETSPEVHNVTGTDSADVVSKDYSLAEVNQKLSAEESEFKKLCSLFAANERKLLYATRTLFQSRHYSNLSMLTELFDETRKKLPELFKNNRELRQLHSTAHRNVNKLRSDKFIETNSPDAILKTIDETYDAFREMVSTTEKHAGTFCSRQLRKAKGILKDQHCRRYYLLNFSFLNKRFRAFPFRIPWRKETEKELRYLIKQIRTYRTKVNDLKQYKPDSPFFQLLKKGEELKLKLQKRGRVSYDEHLEVRKYEEFKHENLMRPQHHFWAALFSHIRCSVTGYFKTLTWKKAMIAIASTVKLIIASPFQGIRDFFQALAKPLVKLPEIKKWLTPVYYQGVSRNFCRIVHGMEILSGILRFVRDISNSVWTTLFIPSLAYAPLFLPTMISTFIFIGACGMLSLLQAALSRSYQSIQWKIIQEFNKVGDGMAERVLDDNSPCLTPEELDGLWNQANATLEDYEKAEKNMIEKGLNAPISFMELALSSFQGAMGMFGYVGNAVAHVLRRILQKRIQEQQFGVIRARNSVRTYCKVREIEDDDTDSEEESSMQLNVYQGVDEYLKDIRLRLDSLYYLGLIQTRKKYNDDVIKAARVAGEQSGDEELLSGVGDICRQLGQFKVAYDCYLKALISARELCNLKEEIYILSQLGITSAEMDQITEAFEYLKKAIGKAEGISETEVKAKCYLGFGRICHRFGNYLDTQDKPLDARESYMNAIKYLTKAQEIATDEESMDIHIKSSKYQGEIYTDLGNQAASNQQNAEALKLYRKAADAIISGIKYCKATSSFLLTGDLYNSLGLVYAYQGDLMKNLKTDEINEDGFDRALGFIHKSLDISVETKNDYLKANTYRNFGILYHLRGMTDKSLKNLEKSMFLYRKVFPKNHIAIIRTKHLIDSINKNSFDRMRIIPALYQRLRYPY